MRNAVKIQFKARDLLPKRRIGKTDRKIGNLVKNLYVSLVNLLASSLCISWLLRLRDDAKKKKKYNLRASSRKQGTCPCPLHDLLKTTMSQHKWGK